MSKPLSFVVIALFSASIADAAPDWCPSKDKLEQAGAQVIRDVQAGKRSLGDAVASVVYLTCVDPRYASDADRALAAETRAALDQQLHMTEADWSDAAAWTQARRDLRVNLELAAANDKAAWSGLDPIEQFATIGRAVIRTRGSFGPTEPAYAADAFGAKLSASGRLAYARACLASTKPIEWAMCQADLDSLDGDKIAAELHADKAHDGYARMTVRLAYADVRARIPARADEIKKLVAQDRAYDKLFAIAAAQRAEWDARWSDRAELVALAAAMDDALVTSSRRATQGCRDATWSAMKRAIGQLPAKRFITHRKSTDETYFYMDDVEQTVVGTLLDDADGWLASSAYTLCHTLDGDARDIDPLAAALASRLGRWPGYRGPRTSTYTAILLANIELDDRNARLESPAFQRFWFRAGACCHGLAGDGVVASVKLAGDKATIAFQKKLAKQLVDTGCRETGRVHSIRPDGSIEYYVECTGTKTVTVDRAPAPGPVDARYADGLKPGMPVAIRNGLVLAAWAASGAAAPTRVLGVAVK